MLARTLYLIKAEMNEKEQGETLLKSSEDALRKSEQRFRQMFENNAAVLLLIESDSGTIVDANPAAASFYGYRVEQLRAMRLDQINTLTPSEIAAEMARAVQQERDFFIFMHRLASGDIRTVEVRSTPIHVNEQTLLFSIVSDVTDLHRAQQVLLKNERLLRESQKAARIGSYINTLEAGTFEGTSVLDEIFGITKAYPHTNEGWVKFMHPDFMQAMREALLDSINNKKPFDAEYKIIRPSDGAERWMHGLGQITYDDKGKAVSLIGTVQDITERKRSEENLIRQAALINSMLDSDPDLVFFKNTEGVYLGCNPAFVEFVGRPKNEIVGKTDYDIFDKQVADSFRENDCQMLAEHKPRHNEEWVAYPDGRNALLDTLKTHYWGPDGELIGVLGISRDITERKLAEAVQAKLQDQLNQAQKMESVGRLAGGVAHDFNNLLMCTMGYAQLCLDTLPGNHPVRGYLNAIVSTSQRSADLTRQLLAFARKQTIAPKVLDLNDAMAGMLNLLRRLIGEDINLVLMPGAGLWPVKLDPSQIDQILANLCVNARDAIAGVGKVTLATANVMIDQTFCVDHAGFVPGAYVLLTVSDDGCGMDEAVLANIFEPFFTTKDVDKGTGLGLATVYGIVKQNEGFIYVDSEPGKGTTFRIYVPRFPGDGPNDATASTGEVPRGRGETVLLVEDEKSLRETCGLFLEALGYKVLVVDTPAAALGMAAQHKGDIHLVFTDVIMPGMNGREMSERLLANRPDLKVLFMSGYTADVIFNREVPNEGLHYIQKPFSRDDLAHKVREVLG
jgi:PAS domain S-box-containing protein